MQSRKSKLIQVHSLNYTLFGHSLHLLDHYTGKSKADGGVRSAG